MTRAGLVARALIAHAEATGLVKFTRNPTRADLIEDWLYRAALVLLVAWVFA